MVVKDWPGTSAKFLMGVPDIEYLLPIRIFFDTIIQIVFNICALNIRFSRWFLVFLRIDPYLKVRHIICNVVLIHINQGMMLTHELVRLPALWP